MLDKNFSMIRKFRLSEELGRFLKEDFGVFLPSKHRDNEKIPIIFCEQIIMNHQGHLRSRNLNKNIQHYT